MSAFRLLSPGLRLGAAVSLVGLSLCAGVSAQSLDPKKPAPMQPGDNAGTVDNFVGNNFFYCYGGPGTVTVKATFKSMGLLGTASRANLTIWVVGRENGHTTWDHSMTLSSLANVAQRPLTVTLKKPTKIEIAVCPPQGGLIRNGGDYTVSVSGAGVRFDPALSASGLIVGTYTPQLIMDGENTAVKFLPDGTLLFASGTTGTWKLFDADSHLYTVTFNSNRLSLKLVSGRGLCQASDPTTIVFQRSR